LRGIWSCRRLARPGADRLVARGGPSRASAWFNLHRRFSAGASGLLERKRATTHWALASAFAQNFPSTTLEVDSIFVRDGQTYTSAGITAGIDLALALIEEDHGRTFALRVARSLVVFLKRPGGQSQFSTHLQAQFSSLPAIRKAQEWALGHLSDDLSAKALAAQVGMSERNFRRLFVDELRETPREYVERIRLDEARRSNRGHRPFRPGRRKTMQLWHGVQFAACVRSSARGDAAMVPGAVSERE
jgi:Helix-turn-helix domain